jgi:hypothetical protein
LAFTLSTPNTTLFEVQPSIDPATGTLSFKTAANAFGTATITARLSDNGGTLDGGIDFSEQSFVINVSDVNDAPIANPDTLSTPRDTALTFDPKLNDSAGPGEDGLQTLRVLSVTADDDTHGLVRLNADNTVTFIPEAGYAGPAVFTYVVRDNGSPTLTAIGTVTITVQASNRPPVAAADAKSAVEDTPLVFPAADLLANDSDLDAGAALSITGVTATSLTFGTVVLSGGTITYTPDAHYAGPASFLYQLSDGQGGTAVGVVNLSVSEVNDAPVAAGDSRVTNEDVPLVFAASSLLGNDLPGPAAEAGQTLTVVSVSPTASTNGTVSLVAGTITYTPAADYFGPASFTYTVQDNGTTAGLSDPRVATATVDVLVMPVNDSPTMTSLASQTAPPGATRMLLVTGISAGPANEQQNLSLSVSSSDPAVVSSASAALNGDGTATVTYTTSATAAAGATASLTLTLQDDGGTALGGVDTAFQSFAVTTSAAAPTILGWNSVGTHGGTLGEVASAIADDNSYVEGRSGGLRKLLVQFDSAIDAASFTPAAVLLAGNGLAGAITLSGITISTSLQSGNTVGVIEFSSALPGYARYSIRLSGVTGGGLSLSGDADRSFTALIGDVSGDGRVNATDLSRVRAQASALIDPLAPAAVRADVSGDGRVNATDLSRVQARNGNDARGIAFPSV